MIFVNTVHYVKPSSWNFIKGTSIRTANVLRISNLVGAIYKRPQIFAPSPLSASARFVRPPPLGRFIQWFVNYYLLVNNLFQYILFNLAIFNISQMSALGICLELLPSPSAGIYFWQPSLPTCVHLLSVSFQKLDASILKRPKKPKNGGHIGLLAVFRPSNRLTKFVNAIEGRYNVHSKFQVPERKKISSP